MRNRQSGFTLIEIMVVVVILAVLGALVVPKILEKVDKARVDACGKERYSRHSNLAPWTRIAWITSSIPPPNRGCKALVKRVPADATITNYRSGGYLGSLPKDPWNNPYEYPESGRQWA